MIGGTGEIINRSEITQSGGKAVRIGLADPNNPGVNVGYVYPLEAEWTYTSIGVCASGRAVFSGNALPIPYLYLLRVQLYNNGNWETVFLCTHEETVESNNLYTANLVGLWEVIRNDFVDTTQTPIYPRIGYIVQGRRVFGGALDNAITVNYGMTWEQYYRTKYEGVDDAQWGYGVDGYFLAGVPSSFTPAAYTKDKRTLEEQDQGYSELDYITAYRGINPELTTDTEVSDTRDLGLLVPRRTEVLSWDSEFGDRTFEYTFTADMLTNETIYTDEIGENTGFWVIRFGSNAGNISPGQAIGCRVSLNTNGVLQYYDDITNLEVEIRFSGVDNYTSATYTIGAIAWMGDEIWQPFIPLAYGLGWDEVALLDQNNASYTYPQLSSSFFGEALRPIQYNTYTHEYPYPDNPGDLVGLKFSADLNWIKQLWQTNSSFPVYFLDSGYLDNPDYRLTFGVGMGFDRLGDAGASINIEVNLRMTVRDNSAGWRVPPEFQTAAYAGPTQRLLLNGLFAPPMTIDGTYVAGATVRATGAEGVTTEVLTGILPAGRRR